jgi:hypothetical protein
MVRQRVSPLMCETLAFSKKLANPIDAIKLFICHYNLTRAVVEGHYQRKSLLHNAGCTQGDDTSGPEVPIEAPSLIWGLRSSIAARQAREEGGPWDKRAKRAHNT